MTTELVVTAIVTFAAGLFSKIVFDWLKAGRNGRNGRKKNPGNPGNPNGTSIILTEINGVASFLEEMVSELKEIKTIVLWSKQIQDSIDPNTGQPRWYNTGLVAEIKRMRRDLNDSLKLERKNRDLLLTLVPRARDGTDPGIRG